MAVLANGKGNRMSSQSKVPFDPFAQSPDSQIGSGVWFWATAMQALFTSALLILSHYGAGRPTAKYLDLILVLGIIATWSLALRTIRERLVELMRYWRAASRGLLRRASESGLRLIPVPLAQERELYIKRSIRALRIIAAGITLPFFVMPLTWTFVAAFLSINVNLSSMKDYWAGASLFMLLCSFIVAGYLHWVMTPRPVAVRAHSLARRAFPLRARRRL
jgi:hypothetical protein